MEWAAFLKSLSGLPAIALDTESNSFYAYFERVCLIQISTPDEDVALDPFRIDVRPLAEVLGNPQVEVVAHAADYDVRCLKRDFDIRIANLFDTMLAARLLRRREVGLAALVREHFGLELAKEHQRSDWGRRPLSADQLAYAYTDTRHLLALRDVLAGELERTGRMAEARQAFARQARCVPRPKRFDPEGYRHIRGVGSLDARQRSLARTLFALRERLAREWDRPPFKVFGNETILELARQQPRTLEELSRVRGMGHFTLRRGGAEIVEAIASAGAGRDAPAPAKHAAS